MNPPVILFPHEPFSPRKVDGDFALELEAARAAGFTTGFYDHEEVARGDGRAAVKGLPDAGDSARLILRGWMVAGECYAALFAALEARGYAPLTSPEAYAEAHYIPNSYRWTEGHAPRTAWIDGDDPDAVWALYQQFREKDAIIKDWVKSAKYRWEDGCFIAADTGEERFRAIYRVFREDRGPLFNRGVVLREFMPIVERGSDLHGLPVIEESRLFFWRGRLVMPPDLPGASPLVELARWEEIARRFASPFITMDVAHLTDGTWRIVEVGDGGVSGLTQGLEPERFYAALRDRIAEEPSPRPTPGTTCG